MAVFCIISVILFVPVNFSVFYFILIDSEVLNIIMYDHVSRAVLLGGEREPEAQLGSIVLASVALNIVVLSVISFAVNMYGNGMQDMCPLRGVVTRGLFKYIFRASASSG